MTGISEIYPSDRRSLAEVDALLAAEGIRRDPHLDYICALRDDGGTIIATGSAYKSTLRCFAVSDAHQGEGLLGTVLSHLLAHLDKLTEIAKILKQHKAYGIAVAKRTLRTRPILVFLYLMIEILH